MRCSWVPAKNAPAIDRKSTRLNSSHLVISYAVSLVQKKTRLNSSHLVISYAVFCLKKKTSLTAVGHSLLVAATTVFDLRQVVRMQRQARGLRTDNT